MSVTQFYCLALINWEKLQSWLEKLKRLWVIAQNSILCHLVDTQQMVRRRWIWITLVLQVSLTNHHAYDSVMPWNKSLRYHKCLERVAISNHRRTPTRLIGDNYVSGAKYWLRKIAWYLNVFKSLKVWVFEAIEYI